LDFLDQGAGHIDAGEVGDVAAEEDEIDFVEVGEAGLAAPGPVGIHQGQDPERGEIGVGALCWLR
jgi:hypothetical protein